MQFLRISMRSFRSFLHAANLLGVSHGIQQRFNSGCLESNEIDSPSPIVDYIKPICAYTSISVCLLHCINLQQFSHMERPSHPLQRITDLGQYNTHNTSSMHRMRISIVDALPSPDTLYQCTSITRKIKIYGKVNGSFSQLLHSTRDEIISQKVISDRLIRAHKIFSSQDADYAYLWSSRILLPDELRSL